MPGLSGRMSTVIKAKIYIGPTGPRIPRRRWTTATRSSSSKLQNVKRGIADVVTAKKRLQLQETSVKQQTAKLDEQAREAVARRS